MEPVDDVYDEDYQMEPVDDGVLPTTTLPPTSQRPPGHPAGEPGGRQHPPQPPGLHDLKSLVMSLINTKNMLEKSFCKTEKVLNARRIGHIIVGVQVNVQKILRRARAMSVRMKLTKKLYLPMMTQTT